MKKAILLAVFCVAVFMTGCKEAEMSAMKGDQQMTQPNQEATERPLVRLKTDFGDILVELRPDKAPKTVENFLKLTQEGFYDSLTFHRIIKGFMIQGGDPTGDGTGGPGYTIPAEITDLKHVRGALATARLGDQVNPEKASSGSQFFICHQAAPHLDGGYTVFGAVKEGIEVVDKIAEVQMADPRMGKPANKVYIQKAEIVKK